MLQPSLNLFKRLDFLSDGPYLLTQNRKTRQSNLGSIVSFSVIAGLIYMIAYFGKELIKRDKVIHFVNSQSLETSMVFDFSTSDFPFFFSLIDVNEQFVQDYKRFLTITISNYKYQRNAELIDDSIWKINVTTYETRSCLNHKTMKDLNITDDISSVFYCLPEDSDLTLGGQYSEQEVNYLRIEIALCSNDTSTVPCMPMDLQIQTLIDTPLYFSYNIKDSIARPDNLFDPIQSSFISKYIALDPRIFKSLIGNFNALEIITDYGWFLEDIGYDTSVFFRQFDSDFFMRSDGNLLLMDLAFYSTNQITIHKRSYLKIQELVANIGGILKIFLLLGNILISKISSRLINLDVINQIYEFPEQTAPMTPSTKDPSSNLILNVESNKKESCNRINAGSSYKNEKRKSLNIINNFMKSKISVINSKDQVHKRLVMSDLEVAYSYFNCKCHSKIGNSKYQLYKKGMEMASNYLNYEFLINKLRETEYLKFLLFNADQVRCFDFFKKIEVTAHDSNKTWFDSSNAKISNEEAIKCIQHYFSNPMMSDIDFKLASLLGLAIV